MQTRLVDLVLNLLRKAQYQGTTPSADELYLVTDDAGITGADVTGALGYVPYNGTTNPNHYATVSSLPTVGNGTIRIKQDNKTQQFTVNQTATQLISLNGLYDYYTINATVHSSPTISGANVSNFTNGWLSYQYQFPNNWEISTTFSLDNPPSETADEEEQMIIYSPNLAVRLDGIDDDEDAMSVYINGTWYNLGAHPYSGENYQVTISSYNQADGVHTVGTYVYVFSPSGDEVLYNAKLTSNVVAPTNTPVEIQFGAYNGTGPLYATMYFDETYINVLDGGTTRYWTGAEKTIDIKANKDDIKNGTLTITQDGSTLGTFSANQAGDTTINVSSGGASRNIGEIVASTIPLTDAGLHLLDGSLISGSGSYSAFVDYIAGLVADYPGLFDTEANWQSAVTTYGVCGKFVYDSVNNTVRLPKYGNKIVTKTSNISTASTVPVVGNGMALGLTNGSVNAGTSIYNQYQMAYQKDSYGQAVGSAHSLSNPATTNYQTWGVTTDGTKSGLVANTSSLLNITNYPLDCYYYIVIATSTKTQIQVDIDEIATDLNGKADTDLSNVTNAGNIKMAGASMPSSIYTDLTLGASGATYQAPANGWYTICSNSNGTYPKNIELINSSGGDVNTSTKAYNNNNSGWLRCSLPVKKGDIVACYYNNISLQHFRFVYAQGSGSEG